MQPEGITPAVLAGHDVPARSTDMDVMSAGGALGSSVGASRQEVAATISACAIAFVILFWQPFHTLVSDWWTLPDAGHGLLLGPTSIWLAWRAGRATRARGQPAIGATILVVAVLLRYTAGLAAELFTMRLAMIVALIGLTVYVAGVRQVRHWWVSFALAFLSVPLPELVIQAIALPLQFQASALGASLLEMRSVPVHLAGNVIRIPGHELFVTEACSGLRSLTALISMAVLMGAVFLRTATARMAILLIAIPIAIVVNGVRVFLTGFLMYFVQSTTGSGFMHATEGWLLFLASVSVLAGGVAAGRLVERRCAAWRKRA